MNLGQPSDFAIEAYHEPSGPQWAGFGRMAIDIHGVRLGDIRENHCSLFHAVDRFRQVFPSIESLWDESFGGLSCPEIFNLIDRARYTSDPSDCEVDYSPFDFLTNTGEQFDDDEDVWYIRVYATSWPNNSCDETYTLVIHS